ncbi:hypothetical protein ACFE04_017904 [Oxalis oulophora]
MANTTTTTGLGRLCCLCPNPNPCLMITKHHKTNYPFSFSYINNNTNNKKLIKASSSEDFYMSKNDDDDNVKGSGTTARERRLLKVREEKRKRDFDRIHNYPSWAKVLEDACKNDDELRAVLGDSIGNPELMRKRNGQVSFYVNCDVLCESVGNPELMRKRVEGRVRKKGKDFSKSKTGSVLAFKVSFRDFNPLDSYIWFELFGSPSDRDVDLLGSAWYVMGRLGAFNSSNLQLGNSSSMEFDPLYDEDKGSNVMPSSFHDISNVEFQDNWGRVWVDLGTSDMLAIDVLLNCLTVLSSEYLGIQQVVFGGRRLGDWEDDMTNPEYGYKFFKI